MNTSTSDIQEQLRKAGLIPQRAKRKKELAKRIREFHDSQNFANALLKKQSWNVEAKKKAEEGFLHLEIEVDFPLRRIHEIMIQEAIEAQGYLAFFKGPQGDRVLIVDWKKRPSVCL